MFRIVCNLFFLIVVVSSRPSGKRSVVGGSCYTMTSDFCQDISSNYTRTTKSITEQEDLRATLEDYDLLLSAQCAVELKPFVCLTYLPFCYDGPDAIEGMVTEVKPCKSECLKVRAKCSVYLKAIGGEWPEDLNCEKLSDDGICSTYPETESKPSVPECKICKDTDHKEAVEAFCDPKKEIFARVKVHEKVTNIDGDFKRIFYRVTVVDNFKQSGLNRGKELWIVTDDREGCECLKMRNNRSYLVGLKMQSVRDKTVYHLDETSIVRKWNRGIGLSEALSKCIH